MKDFVADPIMSFLVLLSQWLETFLLFIAYCTKTTFFSYYSILQFLPCDFCNVYRQHCCVNVIAKQEKHITYIENSRCDLQPWTEPVLWNSSPGLLTITNPVGGLLTLRLTFLNCSSPNINHLHNEKHMLRVGENVSKINIILVRALSSHTTLFMPSITCGCLLFSFTLQHCKRKLWIVFIIRKLCNVKFVFSGELLYLTMHEGRI